MRSNPKLQKVRAWEARQGEHRQDWEHRSDHWRNHRVGFDLGESVESLDISGFLEATLTDANVCSPAAAAESHP